MGGFKKNGIIISWDLISKSGDSAETYEEM